MGEPSPRLLGIDFTCAPSRRKPITVACGRRRGDRVVLDGLLALTRLEDFADLLRRPGPWLAGCDFPFGLPRAFVDALALGSTAAEVVAEVHRRCPTRMHWRQLIDAFGSTRPVGRRLLHRATDRALPAISSTSPLQTRYVPVGFMYYEGMARLIDAGVSLPGLHAGDARRQAVEAWPGLLAHELIGRRSYKNRDDEARREARDEMLHRVELGVPRLGLRLVAGPAERQRLLDDAGGDHLDAALCLLQAAWAQSRPGFGLPAAVDPVEGWITSAGAAVAQRTAAPLDTRHTRQPRLTPGEPVEPTAAALAPTALIDSDHPAVAAFAHEHARGDSVRERAVSLTLAVRDGFRYDPYRIDLTVRGMRASTVLEVGYGWCVPKAALLAATARAVGIPARLGYADVRNHLSTERMRESMKTDLYIWHGYVDLWIDGGWVKATPAFNIELCDRFGLLPLDFDGVHDSIYHAYDKAGNRHMEYVHQRGTFDDMPLQRIVADFAAVYPGYGEMASADFDADVARETR